MDRPWVFDVFMAKPHGSLRVAHSVVLGTHGMGYLEVFHGFTVYFTGSWVVAMGRRRWCAHG